MNYYALWVSYSDKSNLFFDPETEHLIKLPNGVDMPLDYFILAVDLDRHKKTVERLTKYSCANHSPTLCITEIRPVEEADVWKMIFEWRYANIRVF